LSASQDRIAGRLNEILVGSALQPLSEPVARRFAVYCELLLRWNSRTNLTAVRDEEGLLKRHFAESIACAYALPAGIGSVLDFGSGAGFPGIPIALCRGEIAVTLAESQGKKAAFLREAVRTLEVAVKVHAGRAEALEGRFDCVTLRAVDRMEKAVAEASRLVGPGGWLAIMGGRADGASWKGLLGDRFEFESEEPSPYSDERVLQFLRRRSGGDERAK
jgi:16S rRNA (guanine527-N7)-methyltransferase